MFDAFMQAAIEEAETGAREGGIPIGSVLVHDGRIIGRGHNRRVQRGRAVLIYRTSILYTTLSPCPMCSGAIRLYGIPRVIVGENQTFMGEEALLRSQGVTVEVLQDATCIGLMTEFIRAHPELWHEDIGM